MCFQCITCTILISFLRVLLYNSYILPSLLEVYFSLPINHYKMPVSKEEGLLRLVWKLLL